MGVGIRIKKILREKNMTIKELSDKSGVSLNTLYSITKRDSKRIDNIILQKICAALDIPSCELVDESVPDFVNPTLLMVDFSPKEISMAFFHFLHSVGYDAFIDTSRYVLTKGKTLKEGFEEKTWIVEDMEKEVCYAASSREIYSLQKSVTNFLKFQMKELTENLEKIDRNTVGDFKTKTDESSEDNPKEDSPKDE